MMFRRKGALAAVAVAAAIGLAACTATPTSTEVTGDPTAGGTLTWAVPTQPAAGGVDPLAGAALAAHVIMAEAYDTLLKKDDDGEIQPGLALSYEHPDDLTWVFELRDGVKFADGSDFTADDVVYTFESFQESTTSQKAFLANLASVEATGDLEVTFHMTQPDGAFLNAVSGPQTFYIVGREGYGSATEEERQSHTYGTGPFQVVEWQDGVSLTLDKNEDYWGGDGKPYIDQIVYEVIPDESTRLAALQQGTVQGASFLDGVVADQAVQAGFTLGDLSNTQGIGVLVNPETGPLSDLRVRQALSLALDRQAIADTAMFGYAEPSLSIPAGDPTAPEITADTPLYTQNIEKAKELLAAAGQPNPTIELSYFGDVAAAQHPIYEMMQQQAAEAGIDLVLKATPTAELAPIYTTGESWTDLVSIPGNYQPDPALYFDGIIGENGFLSHWQGNPDVTQAQALLAELKATSDPDAKAELIQKLTDEVADKVLILVPIAVPVYFEVWDSSKLQGYAADPYLSRHHLAESWLTQ